ncbi:hypothetical protein BN7_824 [Wickerhamomyces ciferrii]|uniref:RRM domain-containing protein n=1 Tax=Wickerhamomyces ciferrii (strain ATCC 14091 / BCRC 22168 / CBS 111 / JCM 3599 / NBRC 0793 / NRRL Y-1031 F-60-10) TaxID=1206466 RepID=K0KGI7_WICCF|nr:uncharacterized protein BN7_824 [Wickerhamomyces ciferrii]CCH41287.1 hypothetical protein BN7_824 [Wickerhamomyces ciferrii]
MSDAGEAMDVDQPSTSTIPTTKQGIPIAKSIEGYVIIVQNVHEEATEEDVQEFFEEFGPVKNIHLNLDRQTGYVKGYALIEYTELQNAIRAVQEGDGEELLGHILSIDYAFVHSDLELKRGKRDKDEEKVRDKSPERS